MMLCGGKDDYPPFLIVTTYNFLSSFEIFDGLWGDESCKVVIVDAVDDGTGQEKNLQNSVCNSLNLD